MTFRPTIACRSNSASNIMASYSNTYEQPLWFSKNLNHSACDAHAWHTCKASKMITKTGGKSDSVLLLLHLFQSVVQTENGRTNQPWACYHRPPRPPPLLPPPKLLLRNGRLLLAPLDVLLPFSVCPATFLVEGSFCTNVGSRAKGPL